MPFLYIITLTIHNVVPSSFHQQKILLVEQTILLVVPSATNTLAFGPHHSQISNFQSFQSKHPSQIQTHDNFILCVQSKNLHRSKHMITRGKQCQGSTGDAVRFEISISEMFTRSSKAQPDKSTTILYMLPSQLGVPWHLFGSIKTFFISVSFQHKFWNAWGLVSNWLLPFEIPLYMLQKV